MLEQTSQVLLHCALPYLMLYIYIYIYTHTHTRAVQRLIAINHIQNKSLYFGYLSMGGQKPFKDILICVSKINQSLLGLERHESK